MKKKNMFLTSLLFLIVAPSTTLARSLDNSISSTSFVFLATAPKTEEKKEEKTLETEHGKYTFSNARMKEDVLLIDLDYTNKSNIEQTLWSFLAFEFIFEQDEDPNNTPLETDIFNKEASEGYQPMDMNTKAKPGENIKVTIALTGAKKDLPFIVQANSTIQDPIELEIH